MTHLLQIHEPGETPLPHAEEASIAVGIDLGTTHSVIAFSHEGVVEILRDAAGHALVPSVVHYSADGNAMVGLEAKKKKAEGDLDTIASIKRLMGRGVEDIKTLQGASPYRLSHPEQGGMVRLMAGNKERTPVEISADILRALKIQAEHALGKEVRKAVITVPAYFDDAARLATKDAGRLAGLDVLRLVNEPTAAALAYGLDKKAEGIYAVYDLGGGTFDLSLLKLEKGVFQVLATGGDTALGGDDIDHALAEYLLKQAAIGINESQLGPLIASVRIAKEHLSHAESAAVTFDHHTWRVDREMLVPIADTFIERTLTVCRNVLQDAKLTPKEIKGVVLVGGSTRMPAVRDAVRMLFGQEPLTDINPDEAIAAGAALQAEGLTHGSDNLLLDVVPLSLGLETMGGLVEKLIHRNTPIPVSVSQEFTTYQDNQTGMQIHVLQGEREMVQQNRSLAYFELKNIPALPAGIARIKVTLIVDADGLLTVSAEETQTGQKQRVEVRPSYGLPPEEIERMLRESMVHAKEDILVRLLAEARMEAKRAVLELQSAMSEDLDLLTETEQKLINRQIFYINEAISGDDRDRIDAEVQQLGLAAHPFAERRMNKAIAKALKGEHISAVESGIIKEPIK